MSEPIDIVYECRGFVYYDELKDLRPYKGDYQYMKYMDTKLIAQAMEDWKKWEDRPNACSLDFGVIKTRGKTRAEFVPTYASKSYRNAGRNKYKDITFFETEGDMYKTVLIEGNLPYAFILSNFIIVIKFKIKRSYLNNFFF